MEFTALYVLLEISIIIDLFSNDFKSYKVHTYIISITPKIEQQIIKNKSGRAKFWCNQTFYTLAACKDQSRLSKYLQVLVILKNVAKWFNFIVDEIVN